VGLSLLTVSQSGQTEARASVNSSFSLYMNQLIVNLSSKFFRRNVVIRVQKLVCTIAASAMVLVGFGLPSQAAGQHEFGERITGHVADEVQAQSIVIAVPSATPSTDGKLLVTWYGDEGDQCNYPSQPTTAEPYCIPLGRVLDADGTPVSDTFRLGGSTAPDYYGAPYSTFNPRNNEWVAHWSSYARGEETLTQSGLFLRRISMSGEPQGSVFATPATMVDASGAQIATGLSSVSNPTLVWLPQRQEWLLVSFFNSLTTSANFSTAVAYLSLKADLTPITPDWVLIDAASTRPYGISAAVAADGSVGVTYRDGSGDLVFRRLTVGDSVAASGPTVLVASAVFGAQGGGVTFDEAKDRFLVTYNKSTGNELRAAGVTVDDAPTVTDFKLVNYADIADADHSYTALRRSWPAVEEASRKLHVVQHANTATGTAAVHLVFDADSLSLLTVSQLGQTEKQPNSDLLRAPGRPVISQTGGNIAFAYMSWEREFQVRAGKHFVMAGLLVQGSAQADGATAQPVYNGPTLMTPSSNTATTGQKVSVAGLNLGTVTRVSIDGVLVTGLEVSDNEIRFVLPELTPGMKNLHVTSSFGVLVVQDFIRVAAASQIDTAGWTVAQPGASTAKVYARGVVGAGKVQFFVNGREVAWVKAIDGSDPKLRTPQAGPMAGVSYLVRTVPLVAGKNVIEIYVEGERVRRVAYTR
jgi:hypothetical protein